MDIHDSASFSFTDRECINFSPVESIARNHRKDSINMVVAPDDGAFEKVRAILTRKKGRDIFDLYFLIDSKKILFNPELRIFLGLKRYSNC